MLVLNSGDVVKAMAAMRRFWNGAARGSEAIAIFQQSIYDLWKAGELDRPLARIKVDEKNCFGRPEWPAVRTATREALPRHFAVASWKHPRSSNLVLSQLQTTEVLSKETRPALLNAV